MSVLWWVLLLIAVQRSIELLYARKNTRALLGRGAIEIARWQHPFFVALHAGWLFAMLVLIPKSVPANWWLLGGGAVLQLARIWVITTLGPYWTTRIITLPGAPLVRHGPYRYFPHPNYAIVSLEIALVPLAFGAWRLAIVFSLLNAGLLILRLRSEETALRSRLTPAFLTKQKKG